MQVETYEVEQEQTEITQLAADGESAILIEKLGLTGQEQLLNKDTGTVLPYRQITKVEKAVFEALFTRKSKIQEYKDGPIPVRVLQVAAFVKDLNRDDMKYLEIWHPESGKDDPVLVARKDYWSSPIYLLARWGQALLPFSELLEQAVSKLKSTATAKLNKAEQEIRNERATLEDGIRAKLVEGELYNPQFMV